MLNPKFTNQFKKDMKLAERHGYNMDVIEDVVIDIIAETPLPARCREHKLSGDWAGFTECHAFNDVLLIYEIDERTVTFIRLGTHSDLF